jgi:hypothetical protein
MMNDFPYSALSSMAMYLHLCFQDYGRATEALMSGLNLDFGTKPAAKAT